MKQICVICLAVALAALTASCSAPAAMTTTTSQVAAASSAPAATKSSGVTSPAMTVWYRQKTIEDVIGPDLPAGEYVLVADAFGTPGRYALYTYDEDSEKRNDLIVEQAFDACAPVTLEKGQVLVSENLLIYKSRDMEPVKDSEGRYLAGLYKVGRDIPAGSYAIRAYDNAQLSWTRVAVLKDLDNQPGSLIRQEQVDRSKSVQMTLEDGQYLLMRNSYAVPD